jgi:hypothetical protein
MHRDAVLTYPGTNIPLIRGGAPDPPAGDGNAGAGVGAGAGAGSGDAGAKTGDAKPPAEDYKAKYTELEGRYKGYDELRHPTENRAFTPAEIRQALDWSKAAYPVIQRVQRGELIEKPSGEHKAEPPAAKDPYEGIEDLDDRQRAQRITDILRGELGGMTKAELEAFRAEMKQFQTGLGTQQQLLFKLITMARDNPDVDINALVEKSTKAASMGPLEILDFMADVLKSPKEQERAIAAAVEKAKADMKAEIENRKVPPPTRRGPRLIVNNSKETPVEQSNKRFSSFMERLNKAANGE